MTKKLIEVAIPLKAINAASSAEKDIRQGLIANLHTWWARRPLAASRAVVFAQLVDDPAEHPDRFSSPEAVEAERERLFGLIRRLVEPTGPDPETLAEARAEIARSVGRVTLVDPFAGGGSIPLEAQRLGLDVESSDLNPVAVLLNRIEIDLVRSAVGRQPLTTDGDRIALSQSHGLDGLAQDLVAYGQVLRDRVAQSVGHMYPAAVDDAGRELPAIAWLWARTTPCPNPACAIDAPLVRSVTLSTKKGRPKWISISSSGPGDPARFEVRSGRAPSGAATVGRGGARCVACDTAISLREVRSSAMDGKMGTALMAVAVKDARQRSYINPTPDHEVAGKVSFEDPLGTPLPEQALGFRVQAYGMRSHASLFTGRQLAVLAEFSKQLGTLHTEITADAEGDEGYAVLLTTLLGLCISKLANRLNALVRWGPAVECPLDLFSGQNISMKWDFAEGNPLGDASGSFESVVENSARALRSPLMSFARGAAARAEQANAATRTYPQDVVVCTDPPYFDNIGYADLADFFYVWLRLGLRDLHPDLFETLLTPKAEELVATPFRFGGSQEAANEHFEDGFRQVFAHIKRTHHQDIPMTVFYAYKQEDDEGAEDLGASSGAGATGWEKLLQGMVDSGLQVTATWPMRTERASRMRGHSSNALASSVVLACRPRPANAGITDRQGFLRHLRRELEPKVRELQSGGVQPVDMAQASIGPGMAVFTAYAKVVEGGDHIMSVGTALQLINQVLDELQSDQEAEFDADTRWALSWFEQHGMNPGDFGDALNLATARGTAMNALERAGVIEARAGRVRLLDRAEYSDDWDPTTDQRLTVWEVCQHLIRRVQGDGGLDAAAELLRQVGGLGDAARDLAYRLYEIANRSGWSEEALAYNNLGREWPDLVALAARAPADPTSLF